AGQIDDAGLRPLQSADFLRTADSKDAVAADGQRFDHAEIGIDRQDFAVQQNAVRLPGVLLAGGTGAQQQRQHQSGNPAPACLHGVVSLSSWIQAFFTNSDFSFMAPTPSILQSMSWSPSTRRMFFTL